MTSLHRLYLSVVTFTCAYVMLTQDSMSMRSVLSKVCDHNPVPKAALSRNVSIGRGERITMILCTHTMTQTQKCQHTAEFTSKVLKQTDKYGCLASDSDCLRAVRTFFASLTACACSEARRQASSLSCALSGVKRRTNPFTPRRPHEQLPIQHTEAS